MELKLKVKSKSSSSSYRLILLPFLAFSAPIPISTPLLSVDLDLSQLPTKSRFRGVDFLGDHMIAFQNWDLGSLYFVGFDFGVGFSGQISDEEGHLVVDDNGDVEHGLGSGSNPNRALERSQKMRVLGERFLDPCFFQKMKVCMWRWKGRKQEGKLEVFWRDIGLQWWISILDLIYQKNQFIFVIKKNSRLLSLYNHPHVLKAITAIHHRPHEYPSSLSNIPFSVIPTRSTSSPTADPHPTSPP